MSFELPPLPYDYAALEPYIDATTMQVPGAPHSMHCELQSHIRTNLTLSLLQCRSITSEPSPTWIAVPDLIPRYRKVPFQSMNGLHHAAHGRITTCRSRKLGCRASCLRHARRLGLRPALTCPGQEALHSASSALWALIPLSV